MKTMHHPLAYLGWVILVGVVGAFRGLTTLLPFLLLFISMAFIDNPAGKPFWNNSSRAARRAFIVCMGFNIVVMMLLVGYKDLSTTGITLAGHMITEPMLVAIVVSSSIVIALCVFFFTLININRKEKEQLKMAAKEDAV